VVTALGDQVLIPVAELSRGAMTRAFHVQRPGSSKLVVGKVRTGPLRDTSRLPAVPPRGGGTLCPLLQPQSRHCAQDGEYALLTLALAASNAAPLTAAAAEARGSPAPLDAPEEPVAVALLLGPEAGPVFPIFASAAGASEPKAARAVRAACAAALERDVAAALGVPPSRVQVRPPPLRDESRWM